MDGLVYLLNQAGIALSEANNRIGQLTEANNQLSIQNESLRMQLKDIETKAEQEMAAQKDSKRY